MIGWRGIAVAALIASAGFAVPADAVPVVPTITVEATPSDVTTAQLLTIKITYTNITGSGRYWIRFGDGTGAGMGLYGPDSCDVPTLTEWSHSTKVRHAYRRPGTYTITATFAEDCGVAEGAGPVYAGAANVRVLPGPDVSNGPEQPDVWADWVRPEKPASRTAYGDFVVGDEDGWTTRVVVNWGDGSRADDRTVPRDDCEDPLLSWPTNQGTEEHRHRYAKAGTYKVTVAVTSAGCGGADVQRRSRRFTVTVR